MPKFISAKLSSLFFFNLNISFLNKFKYSCHKCKKKINFKKLYLAVSHFPDLCALGPFKNNSQIKCLSSKINLSMISFIDIVQDSWVTF